MLIGIEGADVSHVKNHFSGRKVMLDILYNETGKQQDTMKRMFTHNARSVTDSDLESNTLMERR